MGARDDAVPNSVTAQHAPSSDWALVTARSKSIPLLRPFRSTIARFRSSRRMTIPENVTTSNCVALLNLNLI